MARILNSSHKHWRRESREKLRMMWPKYSKREIMKAFPGRSWPSISIAARRTGAVRSRLFTKPFHAPCSELMADLRNAREAKGLSARQLSLKIGMSDRAVSACERGAWMPTFPLLNKWITTLGLELTVKPIRSMRGPDAYEARLKGQEVSV